MKPWISIVGIGEEGLESLSPAARTLVETAEVLVGGARHLSKVPEGKAERLQWGEGFRPTLDLIAQRRGKRITVLASGDPLFFGAGAVIARHFGAEELHVIPAPGAFSLAGARMRWPLHETELLTVHGRPLAALNLHLAPGVRMLIMSWDGDSPARVAQLLSERGFGPSPMTVLENMGGADEARIEGVAESWDHRRASDLNTIAVECRAGPGARAWPRVPGLPEDAFEHDGQITKREVRAATIAALAPLPGQRLWDVGAGSGAVAIEWLRAERSLQAVAIERHPGRCAVIARNASGLGVPRLEIVEGTAPAAFDGLTPPPDAIFLGGGVAGTGVLAASWEELSEGGRLVANAVTLEAQERLVAMRREVGGEMTRIGVSRAAPVGKRSGFKPFMDVVQYAVTKG